MISVQGNAAIQRPKGGGTGSSVSTATFVNGAGAGVANRVAKWSDASTLTSTNWVELEGNLMSTGSLTASSGTFSGEVRAATFNAVGTAYQMRSTTLIDTGFNLINISSITANGTSTLRSSMTINGDLGFTGNRTLSPTTVDASDSGFMLISGGGAYGATRGSGVLVTGNEQGNAGLVDVIAGAPSGSVRLIGPESVISVRVLNNQVQFGVPVTFTSSVTISNPLRPAGGLELVAGSTLATGGVFTISTAATSGTAGDNNFQINQFGVITSTTQLGVRLETTSVQALANATTTGLFMHQEDFDRGDMHSLVTSSDTVTIPSYGAGLWFIQCHTQFLANGVGSRQTIIQINGVNRKASVNAGNAAQASFHTEADVFFLNGSDTVKCAARQDTGGSYSTSGTNSLTVVKIW